METSDGDSVLPEDEQNDDDNLDDVEDDEMPQLNGASTSRGASRSRVF